MTTKQMAEAAGVDPRAINKIAKKLYPEKIVSGRTTHFTEDEGLTIMQTVLKRNFVMPNTPRTKDQVPRTKDQVGSSEITELLKTIVVLVKDMNGRVAKLEEREDHVEDSDIPIEPPKLIPYDVPPQRKRGDISHIISAWVGEALDGELRDYQEAWRYLYKQVSSRTKTNYRLQAKNAGMKTMPWAEQQDRDTGSNIIETYYNVALDVFPSAQRDFVVAKMIQKKLEAPCQTQFRLTN